MTFVTHVMRNVTFDMYQGASASFLDVETRYEEGLGARLPSNEQAICVGLQRNDAI
jgi:hypothetical protein